MNRKERLELVIFDVYRDGHRRDYMRVLRRISGGCVVWGRLSFRWPILMAARTLVCSTCDDYLFRFFVLATTRALVGRRTIGLSIRSETIFQKAGISQQVKRLLFRIMKVLPRVDLITFMPHWVEPRLARYTSNWMYDLQFWDLAWLNPPAGDSLELMGKTLRRLADGRSIVAAIGHQRQVKGIQYFMSLYEQADIRERFLFVCIGPNWDVEKASIADFVEAGGMFLDMQLRDSEMVPVYEIADFIWACYRPDYDQSSGIFGRALQLGRPAIVRADSYLARLQAGLCKGGYCIPYGAPEQAALIMGSSASERSPPMAVQMDRSASMLHQYFGLP